MLRIFCPGVDRFKVFPVHGGHPCAISVACTFDAEITLEGLCVLNQSTVHLNMFSVIDWSVDRREDDCVVRRLRRLGNVRHQFLFSSETSRMSVGGVCAL